MSDDESAEERAISMGVQFGSPDDDHARLFSSFASVGMPHGHPFTHVREALKLAYVTIPLPGEKPRSKKKDKKLDLQLTVAGNATSEDPRRRLVSITCPKMALTGAPSFDQLPQMLQRLDLSGNSFTGPVGWAQLPLMLRTLDLTGNGFSGPVAWSDLPSQLVHLRIGDNSFSGAVLLAGLPPNLEEMDVSHNRFVSVSVSVNREGPASGGAAVALLGGVSPPVAPTANPSNTGAVEAVTFVKSVVTLDIARMPPKLKLLNLSMNPLKVEVQLHNPCGRKGLEVIL